MGSFSLKGAYGKAPSQTLVLVTGGAGYVGSVLVPKILSAGYRVRVLDAMYFGSSGLDGCSGRCEVVAGDIRELGVIKRSLDGIDVVVHLAGISNDAESELQEKITEDVNFGATQMLVELAKKSGVQRFIYASSCSVYGYSDAAFVSEGSAVKPLNIYGKSKLWSEEVVRQHAGDRFTTVVLRPATVCGYSPRMRFDLVVNTLTNNAVTTRSMKIFGRNQTRSNVHIEDITNCYLVVMEARAEVVNGRVYNVGYENFTISQIAGIVKEVVGDDVSILTGTSVDNRSYTVSSKLVEQDLSFFPQQSLEYAVRDVKNAILEGRFPDVSSSIYRNVKHMQRLGIV